MNKRMTAEEYRRTVVAPALREEQEQGGDPWLEKLAVKSKKIAPVPVKKKSPKKPRQHIEDDHTQMVAEYLEILMMQGKVVEYTHTANETYTRSMVQKARNKRMGVRSGIPDMIIVFPRAVLFLELKRPDGGVVSPTQKRWIEALHSVGGSVQCAVAYGYDEAKKAIDLLVEYGAL